MEVTFLGTSGSLPTSSRSLPSVLVREEGVLVMLDCGEGAQRQMMKAKVGFNKKMHILISHMHGDHVLGLPGLVQSMSLLGRTKPLYVYGPVGIKGFMEAVEKYVPCHLNFEVKVEEFHGNPVLEEQEFTVLATWVKHSLPTLGYAIVERPKPGRFNPEEARRLGVPEGPLWKKLQRGETVLVKGRRVSPRRVVGPPRPGRKLVYSGDTRPCRSLITLAKGADLIIHEGTFSGSMADKAKAYLHSTSVEAAQVAVKAGVKKLALIHVSAIYGEKEEAELLQEARKVFPETFLAQDLMKVEV
ncbi:MAG: ribonuclease Z [Thermoproteota archaeon]